MLDKFAEELREARNKSGITLQQMASKTRIDLKFLQALDQGDFSFMPEPYVRAFMKEYAKMVGLDENKILAKFDAAKKGKMVDDEIQKNEQQEYPSSTKKTFDATPSQPSASSANKQNQKLLILGIAAAVIIILLVYLLFFKGSSEIVIAEKPFEEVIGENKERFIESNNTPEISSFEAVSDSISLSIFASDTSWVKIILDNTQEDEFILFPNSQKQIKATQSYKLILGNSGAIRFQLNDKPLTFTGKPRTIQYIQIDAEGLKILNSPPTLRQN